MMVTLLGGKTHQLLVFTRHNFFFFIFYFTMILIFSFLFCILVADYKLYSNQLAVCVSGINIFLIIICVSIEYLSSFSLIHYSCVNILCVIVYFLQFSNVQNVLNKYFSPRSNLNLKNWVWSVFAELTSVLFKLFSEYDLRSH